MASKDTRWKRIEKKVRALSLEIDGAELEIESASEAALLASITRKLAQLVYAMSVATEGAMDAIVDLEEEIEEEDQDG